MRRGGRLFLLLGVIIAAVVVLFLIVVLPTMTNVPGVSAPNDQVVAPSVVPVRQVVSARIDIGPNTVLTDTETLLTVREIPESEFNQRPTQYFQDPFLLQTKKTIGSIQANQPILTTDVVDAGLSLQIPTAQPGQPRPKAYPFLVNNLTGVADQITPGDFVDVLASFSLNQTLLRPGVNEDGTIVIREQDFTAQSTKTLVQNVQVLRILKQAAPPVEGTPTPGGETAAEGPPATDPSGQAVSSDGQTAPDAGTGTDTGSQTGDTFVPGNWILILAVTDQQAEVIKFSLEQGAGVSLVLRGRGDTAVETTLGATLDLLVSQFGLPLPQPARPAVITDAQLTPVSTTTAPTPTPVPAP